MAIRRERFLLVPDVWTRTSTSAARVRRQKLSEAGGIALRKRGEGAVLYERRPIEIDRYGVLVVIAVMW